MPDRDELILANLIANRAESAPALDVLTFEGGGVREDEVRTYAALWDNGRRIAGALLDQGMQKGDRFAIVMQNHPEFVEAMVAASITGTVFVPIDPRTKGDKLAYMLSHSECRGVVCADYILENLEAVRERLPDLNWVNAITTDQAAGKPSGKFSGVSALEAVLSGDVPDLEIQVSDPLDIMQIIYTSGTTGDPKGVVFPHVRFGTAASWHGLLGYRPDDCLYTGLSLTHGSAQVLTLAAALKLGIRAVFSRKFTKSRLWDITRHYGCTTFNLLGGMMMEFYSEPLKPNDADNPVRCVVSAGMPEAIWENFERRFDLRVMEFYGASEGGLTIKPIDEGPIGSCGKPAPGLEMRIVDADDNVCAPNESGEIIFRFADGSAPVVDYLKSPEASEKKTRGGWLRSGDIGHCDEDGWLFFEYRAGGSIRHNGDFINPGFVEKAVAESPLVADVFVYGVKAASGAPGEKDVVAAVVAEKGTAFDAQSVFALCRDKLEANFIPSYLQVVDEIPKTASEKPQERFLLDAFAADANNIYTEQA